MKFQSSLLSAALICMGASAVQAQDTISRTTDVTVTFGNQNDFSGASGNYSLSLAYGATAFSNSGFNFEPLSNASGLTFASQGGVTVTPPASYNSNDPVIPLTLNGDGTAGSWSADYTTAATSSGPLLALEALNGHNVLDFNGGGSLSSTDGSYNGIGFYVFTHLQGDWTNLGTATGDLDYLGAGSGFDFQTPVYNGSFTTLEWVDSNYTDGESAGIHFDLIGAAVPEPAVWAMLITGFFGIGAAMRRSRKQAVVA